MSPNRTDLDGHGTPTGWVRGRTARALCALLACAPAAAATAQRSPAGDPAATQDALRRLDASLAQAGAELASVDARVSAAREGVRPELSAPVVVLLRALPGVAAAVQSASVEVNGATGPLRRYGAGEREALGAGAVDELFRATLPSGAHVVHAIVTVSGGATRTATVAAPATGRPTWVELTLRDGGLDAAAWTGAPAAARR